MAESGHVAADSPADTADYIDLVVGIVLADSHSSHKDIVGSQNSHSIAAVAHAYYLASRSLHLAPACLYLQQSATEAVALPLALYC